MKTLLWYAGYSYMGINFTYDSPCWRVAVFRSKKERDKWVERNRYSQDTGNIVAEVITAKTAMKIAGYPAIKELREMEWGDWNSLGTTRTNFFFPTS